MTDVQKLAESLNPLERKILRVLEKHDSAVDIMRAAGLKDVEVIRSLQLLANKNVVSLEEETAEFVLLDENGSSYAKYGLPEKKFLECLHGSMKVGDIMKKTGISREEVTVSMGVLRQKNAIEMKKEQELLISITDHGKHMLKSGFIEEKFLQEDFPKKVSELRPDEKFALESLKKRKKILKIENTKLVRAKLTATGRKLLQADIRDDLMEKTTPALLKSGSWKGKKYRRYDVKINVPSAFIGRKQHYRNFLDEVRKKFIGLGFEEMQGPIVETDFWDMDALFMPQFHSARDIHQGYYVKEPKYSKDLPEEVVKKVRAAHEDGFGTGSKGWRYNFDEKKTKRHILRTHDTSISARTLASKDLKIPGKYFQIGRCFRYDVVDATHLPDFNQIGGFVIEEGINFGHLKALLKTFAKEFVGNCEVKIAPSYFPFTEPSAQIMVNHEKFGWIELAGAGIFRPELVKPLTGTDVPVIAWGIGLDRLAMFNLGIDDIRMLFSHDLNFLRNARVM
jgi:phenylalanyl-tRNA synthetase alpha chain